LRDPSDEDQGIGAVEDQGIGAVVEHVARRSASVPSRCGRVSRSFWAFEKVRDSSMRHATDSSADYSAVAVRGDVSLPLDCLTTRVSLGESLSYALQFVGKRVVDFLVAGLASLLLIPLFLAIAAFILLDSRGPVFFRQRRLGLGGRPFNMWKFRTMDTGAEARQLELEARNESSGGVLFKIEDDPRVTRVGRLLRRTSIDELPQLINVLLGDMSLVGPRPLPLRDSALLREVDEARFLRRLGVLPGLTGPWQVGGRSELGYGEMLDMDIDYIQRWSLRRDLHLIASTAVKAFTCPGAY